MSHLLRTKRLLQGRAAASPQRDHRTDLIAGRRATRTTKNLCESYDRAGPARFVYWLCCPCLEFGAQREDMKRVTKSLVGGKGAKKRGGFKDDGSDSLDSTDDDSDDEERGRTGPTRR